MSIAVMVDLDRISLMDILTATFVEFLSFNVIVNPVRIKAKLLKDKMDEVTRYLGIIVWEKKMLEIPQNVF